MKNLALTEESILKLVRTYEGAFEKMKNIPDTNWEAKHIFGLICVATVATDMLDREEVFFANIDK